ncbi:MAG TPA: hypothetical protein PLI66_01005 [Spirochaetales bacterium]|nr:hypothetical protein [Spirochaetales bacterium]
MEAEGAGLSSLRLPKSTRARVGDLINLRVPASVVRLLPPSA